MDIKASPFIKGVGIINISQEKIMPAAARPFLWAADDGILAETGGGELKDTAQSILFIGSETFDTYFKDKGFAHGFSS
jgi:hypothetical protein